MTLAALALWGLVRLLLIGLVIAVALAVWHLATRLRRPPRKSAAWAVSRSTATDPGELTPARAFEAWSLRVQRGAFKGLGLPVWDIRADNPGGPTLIFTPGWGDSRVGSLSRVQQLAPLCARIVVWDPPGNGEAPGKSRLGVHEHEPLLELFDRVRPDARGGIVLAGSSLGAGVSIVAGALLADDADLAGVIAEAPYRLAPTPARNVLRSSGLPWRITPLVYALLGVRLGAGLRWRGFDRALHASRLRKPLLIIHGDSDETCPLDDAKAIADAAPGGTLAVIPGAGHNNLWSDKRFAPQCAHACEAFFRSLAMPLEAERRGRQRVDAD